MKKMRWIVLVIASFSALPLIAGESQQLIDITKNPGCGLQGLTKEQKIARNTRLAKFYFQASVEEAERDYKYTLAHYGCNAPNSTWLYGAFTPPPAKPRVPPVESEENAEATSGEEKMIQMESKAWRTVFPDWGAVPGTFRLIAAWEGGLSLSLMYGGHTKSGEYVEFWEVVTMLVNDEGQVTHYECWNDTLGMEKAFQIVFGKSFRGVDFETYFQMVADKLKNSA